MTLRRRVLSTVVLTIVAGAGVMTYWFSKQQPQERLLQERQRMVNETQDSKSGDQVLPNTTYRTFVSTENGQTSEITYSRDQELIAADVIDDRGKMVRRDFFADGKIFVQQYYDGNGKLVATKFKDDRDNTRTTTPFFPVGAARTGY